MEKTMHLLKLNMYKNNKFNKDIVFVIFGKKI